MVEKGQRISDGQFEHIGNRFAVNGDFQHLGAITPAVAVRAAQINVGQELHFHMLETIAAARRAAAGTRIEAEGAGGVAA